MAVLTEHEREMLMADYNNQKWVEVYRTALVELERAAMTGRILDARAEITKRLEALTQFPGLHLAEMSAIEDALNNLRVLEREEEGLAVEEKNRILQEALQGLKAIAPKIEN